MRNGHHRQNAEAGSGVNYSFLRKQRRVTGGGDSVAYVHVRLPPLQSRLSPITAYIDTQYFHL